MDHEYDPPEKNSLIVSTHTMGRTRIEQLHPRDSHAQNGQAVAIVLTAQDTTHPERKETTRLPNGQTRIFPVQ